MSLFRHNGVREILINKKQTPKTLNNAIQISPDDPKVLRVFKQLTEYFKRERKEFAIRFRNYRDKFSKKSMG